MSTSTALKQQRYHEYSEDVNIAIRELTEMKLLPVEGGLICDLYAIPSHNFQSYYAIIYEHGNQFEMLYAKPQVYEPIMQEPIKMYRFKDATDAEMHPAKVGKIIMGVKRLPEGFVNVTKDIVEHLPEVKPSDSGGISLDVNFQAIRRYKDNAVDGEVVFDSGDRLVFPEGKEYLSGILEDLYIRVGEIIG